MQLLKGCMRESEVDRVWALSMPMNRITYRSSSTRTTFSVHASLRTTRCLWQPIESQTARATALLSTRRHRPDTHYKYAVIAAGLRWLSAGAT